MEYKKAVRDYFEEKAKRFLKDYPNFKSLNKANSEALENWAKQKEEMKGHKIYHKHANLSTYFKAIKKSVKKV